MSELDRVLDDAVADGRMPMSDADLLRTYSQFLSETPPDVPPHLLSQDGPGILACFPDRPAFEAWRSRWLPYMAGLADGPTTPEEYAELLPELDRRHG